jgi:hypothetical protein
MENHATLAFCCMHPEFSALCCQLKSRRWLASPAGEDAEQQLLLVPGLFQCLRSMFKEHNNSLAHQLL